MEFQDPIGWPDDHDDLYGFVICCWLDLKDEESGNMGMSYVVVIRSIPDCWGDSMLLVFGENLSFSRGNLMKSVLELTNMFQYVFRMIKLIITKI